MTLPFNLQKLPTEALDVLRYLGKVDQPQTADEIEIGSGMSSRLVGRAIRRLVNYDYIHINIVTNAYELTTDGAIAVKDILQYDVATGGTAPAKATQTPTVTRKLVIVLPRQLTPGQAIDLYLGVNPPDGQSGKFTETAHVELKLSAINGTLSAGSISVDIPPDRQAPPVRLGLRTALDGKPVRVQVDAYQAFEFDAMESLGGFYFDIPVSAQAAPGANRAVGMELALKPPR